MAKIDRYDGNLKAFASGALADERTLFGELTASDALTDQITADFLRGWGIVGPNDFPTKQDFNALGYTLSQLLAYIHQTGVPEWSAPQQYYLGGMATHEGSVFISESGIDGAPNVGNVPSTDEGSNWSLLPARRGLKKPSADPAKWSSTPQHIFRPDVGVGTNLARAWPHQTFEAYGKKALLFSRYYRTSGESPDTPSIVTGLAFSDDGIHWRETAHGPIFDEILQPWQGDRAWFRTITWDETNSRWVAFAGGNDTSGTNPGVRQIGAFYSDDLINWTGDAANPVITVDTDDISTWAPVGADAVYPDEVFHIDGTWYLFIDAAINGVSSASGDEEPYVGLLQASDPAGPWTSAVANPIFDGSEATWLSHVSCRHVMQYRGKWYMSVQSRAGADELVNTGIATADAITGPWTLTNTSAPLIQPTDKHVGALMVPTADGWTIQAGDFAQADGLFMFSERAVSSVLDTKAFNGAGLLRKNTAQVLAHTIAAPLIFDAVQYDRGRWFDSAQPTQLRIGSGVSLVRLTISVVFASNTSGRRSVKMLRNGAADPAAIPYQSSIPPVPTGSTVVNLSAVMVVASGDYLEVELLQDSGGDLSVPQAVVTVEQIE